MTKPVTWKLRSWREGRELTQRQAGALMRVGKRTWMLWETGQGIPRDEHMIALYVLTNGQVAPNDFYALPLLAKRPPSNGAALPLAASA